MEPLIIPSISSSSLSDFEVLRNEERKSVIDEKKPSQAMELFSLRCSSPPVIQSSSSSRKGLIEKHSFVSGHSLNLTTVKRYPNPRKLRFHGFKSQTSGSVRCSIASNPGLAEGIKQDQSKDNNVVFVAGATGKVGSRTVRELIKLGFQVRAGVRSPQKAETLVQSVQQMKLDEGATAVEKLKIVECDLERVGIEQAIGNASVVICCIGASEKEVFDITGPCRIDYRATKSLIDAATVAGVNHFILVTSLGTNKIGFPAAILNLFWGVLIWKRKAEEALIASGLPYTIVRPGGMERPTDAYKETHNVVLANEDTKFGGQVSNLQVAELMAFMAKNRSLSYCKVVEVIAETTAPLTPMGDLLAKIPSQRVDTSVQKELQTASTPDTEPSQSIVSETSSPVIEKEPIKTTAQISSAVSPYIPYEDLKPPTSPTPTPSTSPGADKAKEADALVTESSSSPSSTQMSSPELSETTLEKKSIEVEMQKAKPLSPFIAYDDLKPPTSPSPTAPTVVGLKEDSEPAIVAAQISTSGSPAEVTETKPAIVEEQKRRPLSPYFTYDDLKPPTSPIPTQATGKDRFATAAPPPEAVPPTGGNGAMDKAPTQVKLIENELPEVPAQKISHLSPYHVYEDLKPPTTPSPDAPTVLSLSSTIGDIQVTTIPETGAVQTPTSDNLEEKQPLTEPKSRPLSPFPMYDDLKPPTSPIPSLRK